MASNGLYSCLCVSVNFFRDCQCSSLQGTGQLVLQQAMDCTPIFVYEYIFLRNCHCTSLQGIVQLVLQQAMDCTSVFVYQFIFPQLAMRQSTGYCLFGTTASNGLYSYFCLPVHFPATDSAVLNLQYVWLVMSTSCRLYSYLCVSVHFPSVGSAVICLNVRLHGYVNKPRIVFMPLYICTLFSCWQCST